MRGRIGIIGAAMGALGAALAGSVGNIVSGEPQGGVVRRPKKGKRRSPGADHRMYAPAKVLRAMRSCYQPHDGAKQAEKDRKRGYYEEAYFSTLNLSDYKYPRRPQPIVQRSC